MKPDQKTIGFRRRRFVSQRQRYDMVTIVHIRERHHCSIWMLRFGKHLEQGVEALGIRQQSVFETDLWQPDC